MDAVSPISFFDASASVQAAADSVLPAMRNPLRLPTASIRRRVHFSEEEIVCSTNEDGSPVSPLASTGNHGVYKQSDSSPTGSSFYVTYEAPVTPVGDTPLSDIYSRWDIAQIPEGFSFFATGNSSYAIQSQYEDGQSVSSAVHPSEPPIPTLRLDAAMYKDKAYATNASLRRAFLAHGEIGENRETMPISSCGMRAHTMPLQTPKQPPMGPANINGRAFTPLYPNSLHSLSMVNSQSTRSYPSLLHWQDMPPAMEIRRPTVKEEIEKGNYATTVPRRLKKVVAFSPSIVEAVDPSTVKAKYSHHRKNAKMKRAGAPFLPKSARSARSASSEELKEMIAAMVALHVANTGNRAADLPRLDKKHASFQSFNTPTHLNSMQNDMFSTGHPPSIYTSQVSCCEPQRRRFSSKSFDETTPRKNKLNGNRSSQFGEWRNPHFVERGDGNDPTIHKASQFDLKQMSAAHCLLGSATVLQSSEVGNEKFPEIKTGYQNSPTGVPPSKGAIEGYWNEKVPTTKENYNSQLSDSATSKDICAWNPSFKKNVGPTDTLCNYSSVRELSSRVPPHLGQPPSAPPPCSPNTVQTPLSDIIDRGAPRIIIKLARNYSLQGMSSERIPEGSVNTPVNAVQCIYKERSLSSIPSSSDYSYVTDDLYHSVEYDMYKSNRRMDTFSNIPPVLRCTHAPGGTFLEKNAMVFCSIPMTQDRIEYGNSVSEVSTASIPGRGEASLENSEKLNKPRDTDDNKSGVKLAKKSNTLSFFPFFSIKTWLRLEKDVETIVRQRAERKNAEVIYSLSEMLTCNTCWSYRKLRRKSSNRSIDIYSPDRTVDPCTRESSEGCSYSDTHASHSLLNRVTPFSNNSTTKLGQKVSKISASHRIETLSTPSAVPNDLVGGFSSLCLLKGYTNVCDASLLESGEDASLQKSEEVSGPLNKTIGKISFFKNKKDEIIGNTQESKHACISSHPNASKNKDKKHEESDKVLPSTSLSLSNPSDSKISFEEKVGRNDVSETGFLFPITRTPSLGFSESFQSNIDLNFRFLDVKLHRKLSAKCRCQFDVWEAEAFPTDPAAFIANFNESTLKSPMLDASKFDELALNIFSENLKSFRKMGQSSFRFALKLFELKAKGTFYDKYKLHSIAAEGKQLKHLSRQFFFSRLRSPVCECSIFPPFNRGSTLKPTWSLNKNQQATDDEKMGKSSLEIDEEIEAMSLEEEIYSFMLNMSDLKSNRMSMPMPRYLWTACGLDCRSGHEILGVAMEMIAGQSLTSILPEFRSSNSGFSNRLVFEVALKIIESQRKLAHDLPYPIINWDTKPGNIILKLVRSPTTKQIHCNRAVIIDLGDALPGPEFWFPSCHTPGKTPGYIICTKGYCSPECAILVFLLASSGRSDNFRKVWYGPSAEREHLQDVRHLRLRHRWQSWSANGFLRRRLAQSSSGDSVPPRKVASLNCSKDSTSSSFSQPETNTLNDLNNPQEILVTPMKTSSLTGCSNVSTSKLMSSNQSSDTVSDNKITGSSPPGKSFLLAVSSKTELQDARPPTHPASTASSSSYISPAATVEPQAVTESPKIKFSNHSQAEDNIPPPEQKSLQHEKSKERGFWEVCFTTKSVVFSTGLILAQLFGGPNLIQVVQKDEVRAIDALCEWGFHESNNFLSNISNVGPKDLLPTSGIFSCPPWRDRVQTLLEGCLSFLPSERWSFDEVEMYLRQFQTDVLLAGI
ncbi:hypothetical protein IE077_000848 [Cardiosporidium cionae]|uniref:Protein kinase domain-containing protein n=1 Tax=Cardiosporidium cionae TaxID=476202 RepID=A0ABQ7J6D1_9APIC|nr:hypothetical protein IE077_000848 [Cardiosporidium cionae]|eukprot:KAF8819552.1 hypothetical protein IE077_000848 [Cardiosporidium cionae]